jgi:RNA polymerase sigma factor (sigma-70 family)
VDPDLPLIEALQAGEDLPLNELINRHGEPLFRFAYRYLHDETLARDVVQDTFVRAYFKAALFKPASLVKTWLYTIALNLCRDQGRRLARRSGDISLNAPRSNYQPAPELTDPATGPEVHAAQQERFTALQQAIDQLPHKLKAALVLFSLEGYSQKEVAEMLETTPKTIELRVAHARVKLRRALANEIGEPSAQAKAE